MSLEYLSSCWEFQGTFALEKEIAVMILDNKASPHFAVVGFRVVCTTDSPEKTKKQRKRVSLLYRNCCCFDPCFYSFWFLSHHLASHPSKMLSFPKPQLPHL